MLSTRVSRRIGRTQARTSSWDSKDYVQENVARGQTENVIMSGNDRYIAAIVGYHQLNVQLWNCG